MIADFINILHKYIDLDKLTKYEADEIVREIKIHCQKENKE